MQEGSEERGLVPAGVVSLPMPVDHIIAEWEAYQELCRRLLTDDDHSVIEGKRRRDKSAWRKLARAFNVNDHILYRTTNKDDGGRVVSAEYEVQATAPNGRISVGIASCSIWERAHEGKWEDRWGKVCPGPCDGRKHFSNPDHTIPATAHTRAKNRAIADLIGAGEVSAEEIEPGGVVSTTAKPVDEMPIENPGEVVLGFSRSHREKKIKDVPTGFLRGFVESDADWAVGSRQKYAMVYRAAKAFLEGDVGEVEAGMPQGPPPTPEEQLEKYQESEAEEGQVEELQQAFPDAVVEEVVQEIDKELDAELTLKEFSGMMTHLRKYAEGAGWDEEQIIQLLDRHELDGERIATKRIFVAAKNEVQQSVSEGRLEEATE